MNKEQESPEYVKAWFDGYWAATERDAKCGLTGLNLKMNCPCPFWHECHKDKDGH